MDLGKNHMIISKIAEEAFDKIQVGFTVEVVENGIRGSISQCNKSCIC